MDFVILWVDNNDKEWQREFFKYKNLEGDKSQRRFRDWKNLKYLFRGIDNFAPWIRKIHFVSWGHLPEWLNKNHTKIHIVKHEDFIDKSCLPTFNSHTLEVNLHRIEGLADKFVYFNDDTFLIKPVEKDYFFKANLPRDMCIFNCIYLDTISHIRLNDIIIINKYFNKFDFIKRNLFKVFNFKYGIHQIRSLFLSPWPKITGFYDPHQPQAFLKKTFEEVWAVEKETLEKTTKSKFRSVTDVNQYLFRYWQLMKGQFIPKSFYDTYTIPVKTKKDVELVTKFIERKKYTMLCINDELGDNINEQDFNEITKRINDSFEKILPKKSSFEI